MTLPKLPNKIRILGKVWNLIVVPMEDASGDTKHATLTIRIDPEYAAEFQQDTVLHEILHAISEEMQLRLGERQIANVATILLGVLKENPEVRKFLFHDPR